MIHPVEVTPLEDYRIHIKYEDGIEGELDLHHLAGKGIFKFWDDYSNFKKVYINPDSKSIAWSDEIDICPDNAYLQIKGMNTGEFFKYLSNASHQ